MSTVADVSQELQTLFTTTADGLARRSGFVQRTSKLTGAAFVQALVCGWLAHPHASVEALAQTAAAVGVPISAQGLDQRFTESAAVFLEDVLAAAIRTVITADPVAIPLLARFSAVVLLDSSTITLPADVAPWWPGCSPGSAALKLPVRYDLCSGTLKGPLVDDGRTSDRSTRMQTAPVPPGALRMSDLGFFDLAVCASLSAGAAFWLTRLAPGTALFTADGSRWDVLDLLQDQGAAPLDLAVTLGATHRLPGRLLAQRVPDEVAHQRRRRVRAEANRGRTPSTAQLAWCDWTILVTNVPSALLSLPEALILLRARWQIELLFKLWKSQGPSDESRRRNPWRILTEVFAKLLAMLVQHWLFLVSCWSFPERSLVKAAQTVQRHAVHLASVLSCPLLLERAITVIQRCIGAGCRLNRRKKDPNAYQFFLDPSLARLA